MTHRIVAGVDFSKSSTAAAEWAARELAPDAEIVLTHVIAPRPSAILRSRLPKQQITDDTLRVGADAKLRALCNCLKPRRVWPEILVGDPASALHEVAHAFDARMIVIGVHGDGASGVGVGATASRLMAESTIPLVVVADTPPARPFHLLAPVDRRESAERVVSETRELLGDRAGRLTMLHVIPANVMKHFVEQGNWDDEAYAGEFEWVDRWCRIARSAGWNAADVRTEEVFGNPAREIRAAAERLHADFVVMPRRNGLLIRRALLGSVTESIVREPPCSVIILPERAATANVESHWSSARQGAPLAFAGMIS